jgi:hypothetical protein
MKSTGKRREFLLNHKDAGGYDTVTPMNALNGILVLTVFGVLISIKGKHIALT